MAPELEHLSYSSVSSYLSCGMSWNYHYVQKIQTRPNRNLVFGSAFHNTVEGYLADGCQGELTGLWRENWTAQLEKEKISDFDGASPEVECNLGMRMFGSPEIQKGILSIRPASHADGKPWIERKVELRVPGVPVPIIGYLDIMAVDGPGDFKTSGRAWTTDVAAKEMQPIFYLAALNQAGLNYASFTHYVFVKTKTPQFQKITIQHKQSEMFWLFQMIQSVWRGIEAGVYPLNPGGWKCSPDYCEYYSLCRGKYS